MADVNIKLIPVPNSRKEYKRIKNLYKEAFPADERAPLFLMKKRAAKNKGDSWNVYDGDRWIGWVYMITTDDLAYVNYLAMDNSQRGKGYGVYVIEEIKKKYAGKKVFLALEQLDPKADNYEQRLKRHAFYERCGLKDLPYKIKEASVVYSIMGTGETVEPEEYKKMMDDFLGPFFTRLIDTRILKE
jgi:GNAT superfamily N-acetyltransferase